MRTRQRGPLTTQAGQPFEAGSCLISRTCRVRSFVSWHIQLCKTLTESCGTSHLQHWRPRASTRSFVIQGPLMNSGTLWSVTG
jgi:hypothetical protein